MFANPMAYYWFNKRRVKKTTLTYKKSRLRCESVAMDFNGRAQAHSTSVCCVDQTVRLFCQLQINRLIL